MTTLSPTIPAATLILLRESHGGGAPETLMVRRTARMAFAAGAWVWPGGRIDPGDCAVAHAEAPEVAAAREMLEEVGIPVGLSPTPSADTLVTMQAALERGVAFPDLLADHGLSFDPQPFARYARWAPELDLKRRFDTWFLIARAPADLPPLSCQEAEVAEARWIAPAAMLDEIARGEAHAIFPTLRNLERLAAADGIDAVFADAAAHRPDKIVPWVETRGGVETLCIPPDRGYPVTASPMTDAVRGEH